MFSPASVTALATFSAALVAHGLFAGPPKVPLRGQETGVWCWAASAEMAMMAFKTPEDSVLQRVQAGRTYPPLDECWSHGCPTGGASSTCSHGSFPQFYKFGFDADVTPPYRPLSFEELWEELSCRPVVFARENVRDGERQGSGHMLVATSAASSPIGKWIAINDPDPPCGEAQYGGSQSGGSQYAMSYEEYLGGSDMLHWIDYYRIHPHGQPLCGSSVPPPDFVGSAKTGLSARDLVDQVISSIARDLWMRSAAGLREESRLSCDKDAPLEEKAIPVARLQAATDASTFDTLAVDRGRLRYLCRDSLSTSFSIEVERVPNSELWRVATIGNVTLASSLNELLAKRLVGQRLEEVLIEGLNIRVVRLLGDPHGLPAVLSPVPGFDIDRKSLHEEDLLRLLRNVAKKFRGGGPT